MILILKACSWQAYWPNGGVRKTKFKILPKVSGFTDAESVQHLPGELVELPESYKGETWLKPIGETVTISPSKAKVASAPENPVENQLEEKKLRRRKAK